jgi:hypothetical protein
MTTFTSEDRLNAIKIVEEAPYHPGYEDAVVLKSPDAVNPMIEEINEFRRMNEKYKTLQNTIVEFIKESNKTKK